MHKQKLGHTKLDIDLGVPKIWVIISGLVFKQSAQM